MMIYASASSSVRLANTPERKAEAAAPFPLYRLDNLEGAAEKRDEYER